MKKILSMILCLALVLSLAAVVSADGETAGLITSADKLADGQQIVILSNDFTVAMGAQSENGKVRTVVETTTNEDHSVVTLNENMAVLTVEKNEDKFALKVDGQYLVCLDDGNNVKMQEAPAYWTISIDEGGMAVISCEHGDRSLQYNSSSPRMACYKNTQASVAIYVVGYAGDVPVAPPSDPKEIVDAAFALADGEKLPYIVTLTGVVTEITAPFDPNFGNVSVNIEVEGTTAKHILLCYRIKGEGMDTLAVGDTITVTGTIVNYKGTIEFNAGSSLDAVVKGSEPDPEPTPELPAPDSTLTIPEANAAASAAGSAYSEGKYYVTGVITEIANDKYGNVYIADAEGNTLYVYGLYSADGSIRYDAMETKPAVGDTITIYAVLGTYKDAPQAKNAWVTAHTPAVSPSPSPETGDSIAVFVALMAVSAMGIAVLTKKKF